MARGAALLLALAGLGALAAPPPAAGGGKRPAAPPRTAERVLIERVAGLLGTRLEASIEAADSAAAERAHAAALAALTALEPALAPWGGSSEIARLQDAPAQERIEVSPALYDALARALELARETDGAFDPTVEPLVRAWDLRGGGRTPAVEEINDARSRVGWARVAVEPAGRTVRFQRDGMGVDLGGIGRGWALERLETPLRELGVRRARFDLGGVVMAWSDTRGFEARVADPEHPGRTLARLGVRNGAVATATAAPPDGGPPERWRAHRFDPRTGRPLESRASVSVVCRSAARADALAGALLAMGRERAAEWARAHPADGVLWIETQAGERLGWRWNLSALETPPGVEIRWMR